MDTNQYMEMFLEESREHLQSLNDGLLALENDPEEVSVVNDIFRNAHTIKGMSATMGFTKIAELTHDMENGRTLSILRGLPRSSARLPAARLWLRRNRLRRLRHLRRQLRQQLDHLLNIRIRIRTSSWKRRTVECMFTMSR